MINTLKKVEKNGYSKVYCVSFCQWSRVLDQGIFRRKDMLTGVDWFEFTAF
jgi:capsule polysaccharide export protein KpsC/LpsZ